MTRLLVFLLALILATIGFSQLAPRLLDADFLADDIERRLSQASGYEVKVRDKVIFQLLPRPAFQVTDMEVYDSSVSGDSDPWVDNARREKDLRLSAKAVSVYLHPWALLFGQVQAQKIELIAPTMIFEKNAQNMIAWEDSPIFSALTGQYSALRSQDNRESHQRGFVTQIDLVGAQIDVRHSDTDFQEKFDIRKMSVKPRDSQGYGLEFSIDFSSKDWNVQGQGVLDLGLGRNAVVDGSILTESPRPFDVEFAGQHRRRNILFSGLNVSGNLSSNLLKRFEISQQDEWSLSLERIEHPLLTDLCSPLFDKEQIAASIEEGHLTLTQDGFFMRSARAKLHQVKRNALRSEALMTAELVLGMSFHGKSQLSSNEVSVQAQIHKQQFSSNALASIMASPRQYLGSVRPWLDERNVRFDINFSDIGTDSSREKRLKGEIQGILNNQHLVVSHMHASAGSKMTIRVDEMVVPIDEGEIYLRGQMIADLSHNSWIRAVFPRLSALASTSKRIELTGQAGTDRKGVTFERLEDVSVRLDDLLEIKVDLETRPIDDMDVATTGTGTETGTDPSRDAPSRDAPSGDAPNRDAPSGDAPSGDAPSRDAPNRDAPSGDAPSGDAPNRDAPSGDAPSGDAPSRDAPNRDAPSGDALTHQKVFSIRADQLDLGQLQGTKRATGLAGVELLTSEARHILDQLSSTVSFAKNMQVDVFELSVSNAFMDRTYMGNVDLEIHDFGQVVLSSDGDITAKATFDFTDDDSGFHLRRAKGAVSDLATFNTLFGIPANWSQWPYLRPNPNQPLAFELNAQNQWTFTQRDHTVRLKAGGSSVQWQKSPLTLSDMLSADAPQLSRLLSTIPMTARGVASISKPQETSFTMIGQDAAGKNIHARVERNAQKTIMISETMALASFLPSVTNSEISLQRASEQGKTSLTMSNDGWEASLSIAHHSDEQSVLQLDVHRLSLNDLLDSLSAPILMDVLVLQPSIEVTVKAAEVFDHNGDLIGKEIMMTGKVVEGRLTIEDLTGSLENGELFSANGQLDLLAGLFGDVGFTLMTKARSYQLGPLMAETEPGSMTGTISINGSGARDILDTLSVVLDLNAVPVRFNLGKMTDTTADAWLKLLRSGDGEKLLTLLTEKVFQSAYTFNGSVGYRRGKWRVPLLNIVPVRPFAPQLLAEGHYDVGTQELEGSAKVMGIKRNGDDGDENSVQATLATSGNLTEPTLRLLGTYFRE